LIKTAKEFKLDLNLVLKMCLGKRIGIFPLPPSSLSFWPEQPSHSSGLLRFPLPVARSPQLALACFLIRWPKPQAHSHVPLLGWPSSHTDAPCPSPSLCLTVSPVPRFESLMPWVHMLVVSSTSSSCLSQTLSEQRPPKSPDFHRIWRASHATPPHKLQSRAYTASLRNPRTAVISPRAVAAAKP
jgi:hypothetical protein